MCDDTFILSLSFFLSLSLSSVNLLVALLINLLVDEHNSIFKLNFYHTLMAKIKNKKNSLTKKKMRGKIMIMIITEKKAHCHLSVEDDDDFLFLTLLIFRRKQKKTKQHWFYCWVYFEIRWKQKTSVQILQLYCHCASKFCNGFFF